MSTTPGPKVRLRSAARHLYGGRLIHSGEEFFADRQDADDLIALHFAVEIEPTPETARIKRTYRRRDLKAEH